MTNEISIALAQLNPKVGDLDGNAEKIRAARQRASLDKADLLVTSELMLTGYPPEDLVLRAAFQEASEKKVRMLAKETRDGGPAMLIGSIWCEKNQLYNAAIFLDDGEIKSIRYKHDLPNYGVFDEKRVFKEGPLPGPVNIRGVRVGVMICEDMWAPDVTECLQESGAEFLVVLNGSPYSMEKWDQRLTLAAARVGESGLPLIYVNQVGGQDELVFDGGSFAIGNDRIMKARCPDWIEEVQITNWDREQNGWQCTFGKCAVSEGKIDSIYSAMILGLRDYVEKNKFPGVLVGLSGGIDSALTTSVAVDALGANKVSCVMMPSPYTSTQSLDDAKSCAALLGVKLDEVNIGPAMAAFEKMTHDVFLGAPPDTTEENIQSRSRGITLMALSNKLGSMLISTGNKSEMSVGYATLYGDMCGGFSVLKDVYKTLVFDLCRWRNRNKPHNSHGPEGMVIPESIITKPPSAELRADQKDEDSLPPYSILDEVLTCLVEKDLGVEDTIACGHDRDLVTSIWRMLVKAEYKRRQAPPGVKISERSFGGDRRYPITDGFMDG
ncbi:MAG: NAD+ synthase [Rhodospirillaceae bacterium]|nr:NAD+ synthase [Rhodospirillaceae bacterium]